MFGREKKKSVFLAGIN